MPVRQVAESTGVEHCQCGQLNAPSVYAARGKCVIVCGADIPKKHLFCRPCALGNHTGEPCDNPAREYLLQFDTRCSNCGFDLAIHSKGTDGRPRD